MEHAVANDERAPKNGRPRRITPERAALYKTARFTEEAHAALNLPDRKDYLRVVFQYEGWNPGHERQECIFAVYLTANDDSLYGYYYESALTDFVL